LLSSRAAACAGERHGGAGEGGGPSGIRHQAGSKQC
jgi:hypothetical protein